MAAHRSGVARGKQNIAGQLTFDIGVVLVNSARLDVRWLVVERADVAGRILRGGKGCKAGGLGKVQLGCLAERDGAV